MTKIEPALDPVIHEITRLKVMAVVHEVRKIEFGALRDTLGVTDSTLSKQLSKLSDAGYVVSIIGKATGRGRPKTWVEIMVRGDHAYQAHLAALTSLTSMLDTALPADPEE